MSKITFTEAKKLVSLWSTGTFPTVAESIRYHFARQGESLSAKNVWQYLGKPAISQIICETREKVRLKTVKFVI
jgi:hypothetical protein